MTKIRITLFAPGGELDSQDVDPSQILRTGGDISELIHQALKAWPLAPGDTIKIAEIDQ